MPRAPKGREELAKGFFKMYMAGQQWKAKLAADEITEHEIWDMAFKLADERLLKRVEAAEASYDKYKDFTNLDRIFLEEREELYRQDYDWSIRSDEVTLQNILTTEVNIRRIERSLQNPKLAAKERGEITKNLMDLIKAHKELLSAAGIDRLSRERKKLGADPIEDWERIKILAHEKMRDLKVEFIGQAKKASSEAELRDRMKFHLGFSFDVIDAALKAHRRVLGLKEKVQES